MTNRNQHVLSRRKFSPSKYGRAPADELLHYFNQSGQGGPYDPNNTSDQIFADYLGDHEDPREEIVRRDLRYRSGGSDDYPISVFGNNMVAHEKELHGTGSQYDQKHGWGNVRLPDGTHIHIAHSSLHRDLTPDTYSVGWTHDRSSQPGYIAAFTGDELNNLMSQINREHGLAKEEPEPEQLSRRRFAKPFTTPASNIAPGTKSPTWMRPQKDASTGTKYWSYVKGNQGLHPSLHASRLAVVLHEIRDRFGKKDGTLRKLAEVGLRGTGNIGRQGDVYTRIRDELLRHASGKSVTGTQRFDADELKRMNDIARNYNWHRVGKGLQLDEAVADYVTKVASDRLKDTNQHLRAAHNLFGLGSETRQRPASPEARAAFLKGLSDHVRKVGVGRESTYGMSAADVSTPMLLKSLRRLGQAEEQREQLSKAFHTSKVSEVPPERPAWTGTAPKVRVSPRARAGQYARSRSEVMKYGVLDALLGRNTGTPIEGVRYTSHPNGRYDPASHIGVNAERSAIHHALHALGIIPPRRPGEDRQQYDAKVRQAVSRYTDLAREYVRGKPNDMLSRWYTQHAAMLRDPHEEGTPEGRPEFSTPHIGILGLSSAVAPILRHLSERIGVRPTRALIVPEHPYYPPVPDDPADFYGPDEPVQLELEEPADSNDFQSHIDRIAGHIDRMVEEHNARDRRGAFGSGRLPYEVVEDPSHTEQDFHFDPVFQDVSPDIAEIESMKVRRPRTIKNPPLPADQKSAVYQSIADHRKKGTVSGRPVTRESTINMLVDTHGFDAATANRHLENFNKLKSRPESGVAGASPQEKGKVRRRKFSRLDIVSGGKGDKLSESDVDPEQLAMGIRVEMEHTNDERLAKEIALDHLAEFPDYYTRLKKVEEPKRNAAYRAPAGGIVVRGTAYKGGEMVPDMKGKFMNPPKPRRKVTSVGPKPSTPAFNPQKLAAVRAKFRTVSSPAAAMAEDGTTMPVPKPKRH